MDLHVDDFGCVPDGRVLERVRIDAGSAVLTTSEEVRATDAGKHIAIPGAVDLVARIAGLVERREVKGAAMAAGSAELTGTLFDPEDEQEKPEAFRKQVHEGRRITVEGAGPGGSILVSDVKEVISATRIILADEASTAVDNVKVILNVRDRVALDNYARRSVDNLTVDLGDRTITDGSMTIGGRGLLSETAAFSSRDLETEVTIRAAGLLVTTIQSVDAPTQVTLAAPAGHDVGDGGPVEADVWRTDSRPGLERLLAALHAPDVGAGEIRFGPGVYDFTRTPSGGNKLNAAIELAGLENLTLRGSGAGATVIRLMPNQELSKPDTHVIETRDCRNLTFRDLSVHGAYLTMGNTNEQMHGIQLNEGSEEIVVERVRVFQSAGDGIRFLGRAANPDQGTPANPVRKVWVDNCRFIQNKRTGVGFQRSVESVWIRNCYIEMTPPSTDSCVDFEPTQKDAPAPVDVIIDSNLMIHGTRGTAVAISGVGGPSPARRVKFSNNLVLGGPVFCTDIEQVTIQDNIVTVPPVVPPSNRIPLQVQRGGDALLLTGNLLVNEDPATKAVISVSEVNKRPVDRTIIANNLCFARSGNGIQVVSSNDVAATGNLLVATGPCAQAIFVHAEASEVANVALHDNNVTVDGAEDDPGSWVAGVLVVATGNHGVGNVSVVGNSIQGATEGVRFRAGDPGPGFLQTPVCALNRVDAGVENPLVGLPQLPEGAVVAGGAASHGGSSPGSGAGRHLVGHGDPNASGDPPGGGVSGNPGDVYHRVDAAPGPRFFVKESGDDTNTGWVAK